jgi:NAD-dependent dihydropyrimidine dehydrogenase PreA subunit
MTYVIDKAKCINCGYCRRVCPTQTIHYFDTDDFVHAIWPEECIDCNACVPVCPVDCISFDPSSCLDGEALEAALAKAREWARRMRNDELLAELAPRAKFRRATPPARRTATRRDP